MNNIKKESLLDKAKRLYSIGTEIISLGRTKAKIITHILDNFRRDDTDVIFFRRKDNDTGTCLCIYSKGKWAQIIKPVIKTKQFEILSVRNKNTMNIFNLDKDGYYRTEDKLQSVYLPTGKVFPYFYEIYSVANKEGNTFTIGDSVKPIKAERFASVISSFKINDYGNMMAVTNMYHNHGIEIGKLEHNIVITEIKSEEFVSETMLEKAKRLYPIGTVFKCVHGNDLNRGRTTSIVTNYDTKYSDMGIFCKDSGWIVLYDKWSEIVGYQPQIGDKIQLRDWLYPTCGNGFQGNYTIVKFEGSWDNPNSVITFNGKNWHPGHTQTVLLKNIKIIK